MEVGPPLQIYLLFLLHLLAFNLPSASGAAFKYLSYAEITTQLHDLAASHPEILRVYSAQDRFKLPHAGQCNTTLKTGGLRPQPCHVWVAELTERSTLGSDDITRAEMLVSGEVHGDEVVGPHVVMAFIRLMTEGYKRGDAFTRRMLSSRIITLIPTTNAIGFERRHRDELQPLTLHPVSRHSHHEHPHAHPDLNVDPNRDFAFDQTPAGCMRSVAARVINELVRERLFRILITFHGGTNVIGYEWGDTQHCTAKSRVVTCRPAPDATIMHHLAKRMRDAAGPAGNFEPIYPIGTMGVHVYPVHGGMEDWAYGASWSGQGVSCAPETLGGYPASKTKYTSSMTRIATFLVETGISKRPKPVALGGDSDMMRRGAPDDGHVPRNVRLLVSAMDSLEPYIDMPARGRVPFSAATDKLVTLRWRIGGAFVVDGTYLQWGVKNGHNGVSDVQMNGIGGLPIAGGNGTIYSASVPFNTAKVPHVSVLYVRAAAVADNSLDAKVAQCDPSVLPQSHLLAARARSGWKHRIGSRVLHSQRVIFSDTLRIEAYESYVRVSVDSKVRWGAGTGRVAAPSVNLVLRHLYPNWQRVPAGNFSWPWSELGRLSARSWMLILAVILVSIVPCALYRSGVCCVPKEDATVTSAIDSEESKNPLMNEGMTERS